MKIGTCFLTVVGLITVLPCLAAPTFDHDPMSIVIGDVQQSLHRKYYYSRKDHTRHSRLIRTLTVTDPLNKVLVDTATTITVFTSTDPDPDSVRLRFFTRFRHGNKDLKELDPADYSLPQNDQPIQGGAGFGTATFQVRFFLLPTEKKRKVYIVASKTSEGNSVDIKQSCFQTINVYR